MDTTKKTSATGREPLNFDLLLFGATGDLAQRKLIPALYHRDEQGQSADPCAV